MIRGPGDVNVGGADARDDEDGPAAGANAGAVDAQPLAKAKEEVTRIKALLAAAQEKLEAAKLNASEAVKKAKEDKQDYERVAQEAAGAIEIVAREVLELASAGEEAAGKVFGLIDEKDTVEKPKAAALFEGAHHEHQAAEEEEKNCAERYRQALIRGDDITVAPPDALRNRASSVLAGLAAGSNSNPSTQFVTATGRTSLTAQSTATLENKDNRSIKDIRKGFDDAIKAHRAQHPDDKSKYKLSDVKNDSFMVSRDGQEFATVRKNANNISYEFSGTLDFNMADIILRASKDTVLILHSSKLEDIEAILKAADTEPNKGKTIKFDAATKDFLAKNGGSIDPALYPSIAARLGKENATKAAAGAIKTLDVATTAAAEAEAAKAAAITEAKDAELAVRQADVKVTAAQEQVTLADGAVATAQGRVERAEQAITRSGAVVPEAETKEKGAADQQKQVATDAKTKADKEKAEADAAKAAALEVKNRADAKVTTTTQTATEAAAAKAAAKVAADKAQAATQAAKPPNPPDAADPPAAEPVRHRPGSASH